MAVVQGLLITVTSLCCRAQAVGEQTSVVAAHGLSSCGSWATKSAGLVVVAQGLSCSMVCGIFPDQGPNLCPCFGR